MKSIRVNADYESVLFHQSPQPKMNEAVEFLALFLEDPPLFTKASYSASYLDDVSRVFGKRRHTTSSGDSVNWWGSLTDLETEKWLNSKITSTELILNMNWSNGVRMISHTEDLFTSEISLLAKSPFDMSGRGFKVFPAGTDLSQDSWIRGVLKRNPVILEPYRDRKFDFSHYVFPSGEMICYENVVDQRFQYKGTLFRNWKSAKPENLSFFSKLLPEKWNDFSRALIGVKNFYSSRVSLETLPFGFSVDSFVYAEDGALKIQNLCEVNFRRTMGLVAYELSNRYAGEKVWTLLLLLPPLEDLRRKISSLQDVIVLSPPESRFGMIFCMARNAEQGRELCLRIKELLSLGEFPVRFED